MSVSLISVDQINDYARVPATDEEAKARHAQRMEDLPGFLANPGNYSDSLTDELRNYSLKMCSDKPPPCTEQTEGDITPPGASSDMAKNLYDQMFLVSRIAVLWEEHSPRLAEPMWNRAFCKWDRNVSGGLEPTEVKTICHILNLHKDTAYAATKYLEVHGGASDIMGRLCLAQDGFTRIMLVLEEKWFAGGSGGRNGLCSTCGGPGGGPGWTFRSVDHHGLTYLKNPRSDTPELFGTILFEVFTWVFFPVACVIPAWDRAAKITKSDDREKFLMWYFASFGCALTAMFYRYSFFEALEPVYCYLVCGVTDCSKLNFDSPADRARQRAQDIELKEWKPNLYFFDVGRCETRLSLETVMAHVQGRQRQVSAEVQDVFEGNSLVNQVSAAVVVVLSGAVMLICPVWRYFFGGLVEEAGTGWGAAFPGPWYASIFVVGMNVATIFLMARRLQRLRAVLVRCIPWFSSLSSLLDRHNAAASTFDYWLPLNCGINVVSWSKMRVSFWEDSMATLASCGTFSSTLMATALVYISVLWVRLGGFLQLGDFGPSDVAMCLTSALLCIVFVAFAFDGAQLNNTLGSDAATLRKTAFTFMEYNVVTSNDTNDEHLAETRSKSSEVNEWIDIVVQHMSVTDEPLSLLGFELTSSFVSTLLGYITTVCLGLSHFCGIEVEEEVNTNLERFGLDRFFQLD